LRPVAWPIDIASEVLPTPGGRQSRESSFGFSPIAARPEFEDASLIFEAKMLFVQDFFAALISRISYRPLLPGTASSQSDNPAHRGFRRHRWLNSSRFSSVSAFPALPETCQRFQFSSSARQAHSFPLAQFFLNA